MSGLCRIALVRNILGNDDPTTPQSYDYILEAYIKATSQIAQHYVNITLIRPAVAVQEYHDGADCYWIWCKQCTPKVPLDTTPGFTLYEVTYETGGWVSTALTASLYRTFPDGGVEFINGFARGNRNYRVDYYPGFDTSGWDSLGLGETGSDTFGVPADLEKAVANQTVINLKKACGASPGGDARIGLSSKTISVESQAIAQFVSGLDDECKLTFDMYVRANV